MRLILKILILLMLTISVGIFNPLIAQKNKKTKKQLQYQQKKIARKINYTKRLLKETKNKNRVSINQLSLLRNQVKERRLLINSYSNEISIIDVQVKNDKSDIKKLEEGLKELKKEYAQLIYQSYKSRNSFDQWMFLFASKDFYQAMRRIRYLKNYNEYRRSKAEEIEITKNNLQIEIESLQQQKEDRLKLLMAKEIETQDLEHDKAKKQSVVNALHKEEKALRRKLQKQTREWNNLNKKIQELIEAEIQKRSPNGSKIPLTPAEVQLSKNFVSNIGKLPWPTKRARIVSKYGKHPHPDLQIMINNNGVDMQCEKGSSARAVFAGKVVAIYVLPKKIAIIIKHGQYYTVYSGLDKVFVQEGEMVKTKQKLGSVWEDNISGETILHFELRKEKKTRNPERWMIHR